MGSTESYSVQEEAHRLFVNGILSNPLIPCPKELNVLSDHVEFEGCSRPSIPINWRIAENVAALKAFEATMLNLLLVRKYNASPARIVINTDHASLYVMSFLLPRYQTQDGEFRPFNSFGTELSECFPNEDKHRTWGYLYRGLATNIYKTKDGRFYHTHGSLNPDHTLKALNLPLDGQDGDTYDTVVERIQETIIKHDSQRLDELMNEQHRQAGTIAYTADEYFATEHGQKSGKIGLYEIKHDTEHSHPASWWPEDDSTPSSVKRPLAGLKVVDLTRVIASPSITRGLAEMGASVMRVTSPQITDLSAMHQDLNWGKWNCSLHLKDEKEKEKLRALIREADVVVDGYRPGVMERFGFGRQAIYDLVKNRSRGIIHVRENSYGWHGPWSHRSGWQQISDACCGVSRSFAQAMGVEGAVTPAFPNSDYCAGICGSTAVLDALIKRATEGGNYGVDVALNYYSQWLVRSCGIYPPDVWQELWTRHGSPKFQHYHGMQHLMPNMMKLVREHDSDVLFDESFFEKRRSEAVKTTFIQLKPVARFEEGSVELRYNVGTRGNGIDQARWPDDLSVEIVR